MLSALAWLFSLLLFEATLLAQLYEIKVDLNLPFSIEEDELSLVDCILDTLPPQAPDVDGQIGEENARSTHCHSRLTSTQSSTTSLSERRLPRLFEA